jgi:hypothetical protein
VALLTNLAQKPHEQELETLPSSGIGVTIGMSNQVWSSWGVIIIGEVLNRTTDELMLMLAFLSVQCQQDT